MTSTNRPALHTLFETVVEGLKVPSKPNVKVCMEALMEASAQGGEYGANADRYLLRIFDLRMKNI